jgi:hypothetical protein
LKGGHPKIKTAGDLYKEEIKLLMKGIINCIKYIVNPTAFAREKEKNDFDRTMIEKKKKQRIINEKVFGF